MTKIEQRYRRYRPGHSVLIDRGQLADVAAAWQRNLTQLDDFHLRVGHDAAAGDRRGHREAMNSLYGIIVVPLLGWSTNFSNLEDIHLTGPWLK